MDFSQVWFKLTDRLLTDYCCLEFDQRNPNDYYRKTGQISDVSPLLSDAHLHAAGSDRIICASANSEAIPSEGPLMCPTFRAGHDSPSRDGAHIQQKV